MGSDSKPANEGRVRRVVVAGAVEAQRRLIRIPGAEQRTQTIAASGAHDAAKIIEGIVPSGARAPLLQVATGREREWEAFLEGLERDCRIDRHELLRLLPDGLEVFAPVHDCQRAENVVAGLEQALAAWPYGTDEPGRRYLARKLAAWKKRLTSARRARTAAHFTPGRGRRFTAAPDPRETWAEFTRQHPEWLNPAPHPWFGDRAYEVHAFLLRYVSGERSRGRRAAQSRRGRIYASRLLELTAEILNRYYRRALFHKINFTPDNIRSCVQYRHQKRQRKSQ